MAFCSEDGFMGSRKEDLQTRAINFHIKGARSRELLIHIKRALNSSSFPAHLVIGNQSFPSIWCSGHREVTPVSVPSCCLAVGREGHASEGGTEGWHRAGAQSGGTEPLPAPGPAPGGDTRNGQRWGWCFTATMGSCFEK